MEIELPDAPHPNQAEIANPQLFAPLVEYFEHQLYLVQIIAKAKSFTFVLHLFLGAGRVALKLGPLRDRLSPLRVPARTRTLRWRVGFSLHLSKDLFRAFSRDRYRIFFTVEGIKRDGVACTPTSSGHRVIPHENTILRPTVDTTNQRIIRRVEPLSIDSLTL